MFTRDESNPAMAIGPPGFTLPGAIVSSRSKRMKSPGQPTAEAEKIRALTLAVRRGDEDAFFRFYDLYSFRLYKFLLVFTRGDEHEAREVSQAVFIKLAKRFKVFDDERQLWAWLCVLAKNVFIDHCRARKRLDRFVSLEHLPAAGGAEGNAVQPLSEMMREALAGLPWEERELIQAVYIDERPLQELAGESGQTYKAIESRLARLRLKLKEHLLKKLRHENKS
jgi:RNA polymerase sigma-70 factor (ECF subfamily)